MITSSLPYSSTHIYCYIIHNVHLFVTSVDLESHDWHLAMAMQFIEGDECQVCVIHHVVVANDAVRYGSSIGKRRRYLMGLLGQLTFHWENTECLFMI